MKYLLLHYPACGTCRKAIRWLRENGIDVETRDIVLQNPGREELDRWVPRSGLPVRKFFNTSGLRYKELHLKERIRTESTDQLLNRLSSDGKLVKRPVLVSDEFVLVGFDEQRWKEKLLR